MAPYAGPAPHAVVPSADRAAAALRAPAGAALYRRIPLYFEANRGQAPAAAAYLAHGPGYSLALTAQGPVLALGSGTAPAVLRMRLVGARPGIVPQGRGRQPGTVNYLRGRTPAGWRQAIPTYARVDYPGVYPGIDLSFHGRADRLEYDFRLAPGVSPDRIRLRFDGAGAVRVDGAGRLHVRTAAGELVQHPPQAYQRIDGRVRPVASRYAAAADGAVGLRLGRYDHRRAVVIDPVLSFAAVIGGSGDERGMAIARQGDSLFITGHTDSTDFLTALQAADSGLAVADPDCGGRVGCRPPAYSDTFSGTSVDTAVWQVSGTAAEDERLTLTTGAANGDRSSVTSRQPLLSGDFQVQVALSQLAQAWKRTGLEIIIGADTFDFAVESTDTSQSYAVTHTVAPGGSSGTVCTVAPAAVAAAAADFQSTGQLVARRAGGVLTFEAYSPKTALLKTFTVLGNCSGVGTGAAPVALFTQTQEAAAKQSSFDDFYVSGSDGGPDAFVLRLDNGGTTLGYATYLGGSAQDEGLDIAVDGGGSAYVAGRTFSADFPATAGAFSTTCMDVDGDGRCDNGADAFIARLSSGGGLTYASYLGGCFDDAANAVAVDDGGDVYLAGYTNSGPDSAVSSSNACSTEFPVKNSNAAFTSYHGRKDAFVAKISPAGAGANDLVYSMFLGGADADEALGIAVSAAHEAYVTGYTASSDFPLAGAIQSTLGSSTRYDAFVAQIDAAGDALSFSTLLGGSGYDYGQRIALSGGDVYVTGWTTSGDPGDANAFPVTGDAVQAVNAGNYDAFVARIRPAAPASLVYSTYLGGGETDAAQDIAVDAAGNPVITGYSESRDFLIQLLDDVCPVANVCPDLTAPLQALGNLDNLVLNNMSTGDLAANLHAMDTPDHRTDLAALQGETRSDLIGAIFDRVYALMDKALHPVQHDLQGSTDAIVVRLNGSGGIDSATFLGGGDDDAGMGVAVDSTSSPARVYVTGYTVTNTNIAGDSQATNFPSTQGGTPWKTSPAPGQRDEDVFVASLSDGESDLAVTLGASPSGHVAQGQPVTYTITVTNRGGNPATGVVVTDTLPTDIVMVSAQAEQGSCSPSQGDITKFTNKITCQMGTMAAGETRHVTIKTTAGAMPQVGTPPLQTASVTSWSSGRSDTAQASLLTTIEPSPPLQSERTCNISSTKAYGCSPPKLGGLDGWTLAALAALLAVVPQRRRQGRDGAC